MAGITVASMILLAIQVDGEPTPILVEEFIYEEAPFPSCHASTIAELPDGSLVTAWFGGSYEKHPDVGIWVSRQVSKENWSPPVEVANGIQYSTPDGKLHRYPCWNPVLYQPADGPLLLFYKVGPTPPQWWGMLTTSIDGGQTWNEPRRLPEGILGPVKNKPITLANGTLLCGTSTEEDGWRVHFERTVDLGKTWIRVGPINEGKAIAAIQPSILTLADGSLLALGRSRQGKVWKTISNDNGLTWSPLKLTELPNPSAGTDAVTLADGRHLIAYNATTRARTPLSVGISDDDGASSNKALDLETEPGEYSYPAVIQSKDGLVHITYTWKRERVKHVVLDPNAL